MSRQPKRPSQTACSSIEIPSAVSELSISIGRCFWLRVLSGVNSGWPPKLPPARAYLARKDERDASHILSIFGRRSCPHGDFQPKRSVIGTQKVTYRLSALTPTYSVGLSSQLRSGGHDDFDPPAP